MSCARWAVGRPKQDTGHQKGSSFDVCTVTHLKLLHPRLLCRAEVDYSAPIAVRRGTFAVQICEHIRLIRAQDLNNGNGIVPPVDGHHQLLLHRTIEAVGETYVPASDDAVRLSSDCLCKNDMTPAASSLVSCAHTFGLGAEAEGALDCQPVPVNENESREPVGRLADARCACFEPGFPTRGTLALTSAAAERASQKMLVRIVLDWRRWQEEDREAQVRSSQRCIHLYIPAQKVNRGYVRTARSRASGDSRDKRGPQITPTSLYVSASYNWPRTSGERYQSDPSTIRSVKAYRRTQRAAGPGRGL